MWSYMSEDADEIRSKQNSRPLQGRTLRICHIVWISLWKNVSIRRLLPRCLILLPIPMVSEAWNYLLITQGLCLEYVEACRTIVSRGVRHYLKWLSEAYASYWFHLSKEKCWLCVCRSISRLHRLSRLTFSTSFNWRNSEGEDVPSWLCRSRHWTLIIRHGRSSLLTFPTRYEP